LALRHDASRARLLGYARGSSAHAQQKRNWRQAGFRRLVGSFRIAACNASMGQCCWGRAGGGKEGEGGRRGGGGGGGRGRRAAGGGAGRGRGGRGGGWGGGGPRTETRFVAALDWTSWRGHPRGLLTCMQKDRTSVLPEAAQEEGATHWDAGRTFQRRGFCPQRHPCHRNDGAGSAPWRTPWKAQSSRR